MAKGRFLSRTIATSRQLDDISLKAELLFYRCIPHLDREGRIYGDPELLKAAVAPKNRKIALEEVPSLLEELDKCGLIVWYSVRNEQVAHFPGFPRHQLGLRKEREAPSRFPPPGASPTRCYALSGENSCVTPETAGLTPASTAEQVRTNSGVGPAEVKGSLSEVKGSLSQELNGTRRKKRTHAPTPIGNALDAVKAELRRGMK